MKVFSDIEKEEIEKGVQEGNEELVLNIFSQSQLIFTKEDKNSDLWHYLSNLLLLLSIRCDRQEVLKFLISLGVNLNNLLDNGFTPLTSAVLFGNFKIVELLVFNIEEVDINVCQGQALIEAINSSNYEIVKFLIDAGAKMDFIDSDSSSILSKAVEKNNLEMVELLMACGFKIEQNEKALNVACCFGFYEIAKTLINLNMDVNFSGQYKGFTPLHWASNKNHLNIIELLLNNGADKSKRNKFDETAADVTKKIETKQAINNFKLNQKW